MGNEYVWNLIAKKLSGEASPKELQDLESQLRVNPELHYSLQTIMDLWKAEAGINLEQVHTAFDKHICRMQQLGIDFHTPGLQTDTIASYQDEPSQYKLKKNLLWLTPALIAMALLLILGLKFYNASFSINALTHRASLAEKTISEISTQNGSKTNIVLPDGTHVWLNAGSKLTYDKNFGNNIREVVLTGEAFFDVVHNAEKPFIIHAASISIKVLGTKFDVKSYPTDKTTEATLIRGSIEVSFKDRPSEKIILKPNEKIIVANDKDAVIKQINAKIEREADSQPIVAIKNLTYYQQSNDVVETAWVENKLIFQNQSFEDLAGEMERWYGVNISFKNPEMQKLYFTGNFKNENITQALNALKLSNNFDYKIDGNNVTILK